MHRRSARPPAEGRPMPSRDLSGPPGPTERRRRARAALAAPMVGVGLFVVLNVILQLSPPHYSLVSQAVSDLAIGRYGWAMDAGFFLCGGSIVAFVAGAWLTTTRGTRPRVGFLLLAVWGLATMAIAFAHPDLVDANGYPGTLKAFDASPSIHGKVHLAIAAVVFLSMLLGIAVSSVRLGREPRLRPVQRTARVIAAIAVIGLVLTDPLGTRGYYGLMERGVSLLGLAWVVIVAWQLRRDQAEPPARPGPIGRPDRP
jgi:hypothetical membrane protein